MLNLCQFMFCYFGPISDLISLPVLKMQQVVGEKSLKSERNLILRQLSLENMFLFLITFSSYDNSH